MAQVLETYNSVKSGLRDIFRHGRLTGVKGYHDLKVAEAMS